MPKNFAIRWTIEGVPELSRVLLMTHKKLDDFSKPLFKASQMILDDVETQFRTEGSLSGGWAPLKLSTIIDKAKKGYGGKPILERTGALKRVFIGKLIVGERISQADRLTLAFTRADKQGLLNFRGDLCYY